MKYLFFILFFVFSLNSFSQKGKKNLEYKFTYLYSDALKYKFDQNYDAALELFNECLKYKPNSSATLYQMSLIYAHNKEYQTATDFINRALNLVPYNEWYLLLKAELAAQMDDNKAFVRVYKNLYKYFPENPEYAYKLAVIDYKQENYNEALDILNDIEREQGVVENISFLKNNIYYQIKRYDLLLDELKKLVAVFPDSVKYIDMLAKYYLSMRQTNKALDIYQQALLKFPDNRRLSFGLAQLYGNMKNYSEGYTFLIRGIGASGIKLDEISGVCQNYLNSREISSNKKKDIYNRLILAYPNQLSFQTEFINYLLHEKEFELAEQRIKQILNTNPDNFDLWIALMDIYASQKLFKLLQHSAQEALTYFPNQALIYFYSGYADFFLKNFKSSIASLNTGLDYIVDNEDIKLQFYQYLAEAYHAVDDSLNSDKYFDKYLSLNRHNPLVMNNYAYYLSEKSRDLEKALYFAERAIEIEPFNPSFLDTYAWILYLKKSYKDALFNIEKAYKYGGYDNALICEHYAYILLKNDQVDKAKEMIIHSLKLNPDNFRLKDLLDRLE
ncbi:MAG: tetratricopeptide repeat protein [Bacteroidales bacterium]|nr:tetratricopeptide repeat protein [Bacteroidales bacterium]